MLAVAAPDPVMSMIAPVGLAASAGTALLVDRIARGPSEPGRTLADLMSDGPSLDEISPGRTGVARIPAGPLDGAGTLELANRLVSRWPAIVVRTGQADWPGPTVPVHVLYGAGLRTWTEGAAVWQSLANGHRPPGPGPVLPPLAPSTVRHLLRGWMPKQGRWTAAWRQVWEMPWA